MTDRQTTPMFVLPTKLHRPQLAPWSVDRQTLVARLQQGGYRPFTLISAPPGYGKTTLVSAWLETVDLPWAWLSLDEYDAELSNFVTCLVAAVRTLHPDFGGHIYALLQGGGLLGVHQLAEHFLAELFALDEPIILVLDDYHALDNLDIHSFVRRLLEYLPSFVHIVITLRTQPPLPFARLRAQQRVLELRSSDLQFTRSEIGALLKNIVGEAMSDEAVALLEERTEGWPVALCAFAYSLQDGHDRDAMLTKIARSQPGVLMDYLLEEVLAHLSHNQRAFLLSTSILDRFSAPLCAAIVPELADPTEAQAMVASLRRRGLFFVALDDDNCWFRYHQLFRLFLQQRLQQTETVATIATLHRQASLWFEEKMLVEDAILHALRAKEVERATALAERAGYDALVWDDRRRLAQVLNLLPESMSRSPGLLLARAFLYHYYFRGPAIINLVDAGEAALAAAPDTYLPDQRQILQGVIHALRAGHCARIGQHAACVSHAKLALEKLPKELTAVRSLAEFDLWYTLAFQGQGQEATQQIRLALQERAGFPPDTRACRIWLALCAIYYLQADLPTFQSAVQDFRAVAARAERPLFLGWICFGQGWFHYQQNQLDAAIEQFSKLRLNKELYHGRTVVDGLTGLALALHAAGETQAARDAVEDLRTYVETHTVENGRFLVKSLAERLGCSSGPELDPTTLLREIDDQIKTQIVLGLWEQPALTAVRLCIRNRTALETAAAALERAYQFALENHVIRLQIEIGALQGALHAVCGDVRAGLAALARAVRLGESGGALRLVADAGPEIVPLLHRLLDQRVAPAYVERILVLLAGQQPRVAAPAPIPPSRSALPRPVLLTAHSLLHPEELTHRESEILMLLAERLSNKEIARQLSISPRTVQQHTINLYRKLAVENRRQAVSKAYELGLIQVGQSHL